MMTKVHSFSIIKARWLTLSTVHVRNFQR
jgi:hypothetical protein